MKRVRVWLTGAGLFGLAVGVSAVLYDKSRAADFDGHARAIEAVGGVRHHAEILSEQVLAARFGLLNYYDPIVQSELGLADAGGGLGARLGAVVPLGGELEKALADLDASIAEERRAVEHFKAENSLLKNSLYYLPTITQDVLMGLAAVPVEGAEPHAGAHKKPAILPTPPNRSDLSLAVHRVANAALVYNLVGDQSARDAHVRTLADLRGHADEAPANVRSQLGSLLAHATVIGEKQPSVDGWVKQVVESDVAQRLATVEKLYQARFGDTVAYSNRYRNILYGWSLLLVVAVAVAGAQLRRLYADLERRVVERTAELREALAALWGEMRLARKIQEALVPASPELAGCEVAALMKPTQEVGGDYYDVVHAKDSEWILIGDVSGHGVPAGLIMMMCQTAVRTVLDGEPTIMPDKLLARVNKVLHRNVRQLGEDKYMTISAFRRDRDGTLTFAGAHQDVLVYRSQTDTTERFETRGIWLGIKEDITASLDTQRLKLGSGDVLVLYTDGITEAARGGTLFEPAGVDAVLKKAKGKTAKGILAEIFAAIDGFTVSDDATAIVVRQS